jgi:hypothetical protein
VASEPIVTRVRRDSVIFCLAAAAGGWALAGRPAALGVLGGGLLAAISFYSLGGGVAAIVAAASGDSPARPTMVRGFAKLVVRYALLGFLAYVMIARLRLHPIGLLVGASSVVAAAFVEAVRLLAKRTS